MGCVVLIHFFTDSIFLQHYLVRPRAPIKQYYPFVSGKVKHDSPLAQLLAKHGITPENSNQFEGCADW